MGNLDAQSIYRLYTGIVLEASEVPGVPEQKQKPVTQEQKDRLSRLKIQLEEDAPIFSKLIRLAPVIFTYDFDTMAVDQNNNLYINPNFFDQLNDKGVITVLAHEMYHIFHKHPNEIQIRNLDRTLWNYATDYVINRDLLEYGMDFRNITKDPKKPFNALIPKKIKDKYILRIGNINIDATTSGVFDLYKKIFEEAQKQNKKIEELLKELEEQTGKNDIDEEPIDTNEPDEPDEPKKHVYKVGEKVQELSSSIQGIVVKASIPDENGDQILDIDWDISVVEKYIKEEIETGVLSQRITPINPPQPPQPPKQGKPSKQDQKPNQQKQGDGKPDKSDAGDKPGDKPGKSDAGDKPGVKPDTSGKPGDKPTRKPGKPTPAPEQTETPRDKPLTDYEKEEIRKEGEHVQKTLKKGKKLEIKGKGSVNWVSELSRLLRQETYEKSTFLPDYRSTGAGAFIRGTEKVKEDYSITVMVDTSQSVSKEMFKLFMREIVTIVKRLPEPPIVNVILWHDVVYSGKELFNIRRNNIDKLLTTEPQFGGTVFSSALRFYSAHQKELRNDKAIIVFTDGDFYGQDNNPNLLNTYVKANIPIIFTLFQPSTTRTIDTYKRNNKRIIETNISSGA